MGLLRLQHREPADPETHGAGMCQLEESIQNAGGISPGQADLPVFNEDLTFL